MPVARDPVFAPDSETTREVNSWGSKRALSLRPGLEGGIWRLIMGREEQRRDTLVGA